MEECCKQWTQAHKDWDKMWDLMEVEQEKKSPEFPENVMEAAKVWKKLKANAPFLQWVYENVKEADHREVLVLLDVVYEGIKNKPEATNKELVEYLHETGLYR